MPFFINRGIMPLPTGLTTLTFFDSATKSTKVSLSNNNLTVTANAGAGNGTDAFANSGTGFGLGTKRYFEVTIGGIGGAGIGFVDSTWVADSGTFIGNDAHGLMLYQDGHVYVNGSDSAYIPSFTTGDRIGVAFDSSNVWFRKNNGTWNVSAGGGDPATTSGGIALPGGMSGTIRAATELEVAGDVVTFNFSGVDTPFTDTPPSGYAGYP